MFAGRERAVDLVERSLGLRLAVVSITDPPPETDGTVWFPRGVPVLHLSFMDIKPPKIPAAWRWHGMTAAEVAMKPEQAALVWRFMAAYHDVDLALVHCEHGASRSPGVVAGILDGMGADRAKYVLDSDGQRFGSGGAYGNGWCREMMRRHVAEFFKPFGLCRPDGFPLCPRCGEDSLVAGSGNVSNGGRLYRCRNDAARFQFPKPVECGWHWPPRERTWAGRAS